MSNASEKNKRLVLEGFDTLFNKRDYVRRRSFGRQTISGTALTSHRGAKDGHRIVADVLRIKGAFF